MTDPLGLIARTSPVQAPATPAVRPGQESGELKGERQAKKPGWAKAKPKKPGGLRTPKKAAPAGAKVKKHWAETPKGGRPTGAGRPAAAAKPRTFAKPAGAAKPAGPRGPRPTSGPNGPRSGGPAKRR